MSGLILGFKPPVKGEKKSKRPPPLPPRDEISEDSLEDAVSDLDSYPQEGIHVDKQASKRALDVETILK